MGDQVNSSISLYSKENFGILSKNIDGDNESLSALARNEDKNHFVNFSKFLREKKEELERSKIFSKEKNSDLDFSKIDSKDKEEVIKCRTNFFEVKFLPFLKNPKSKDKVDLDEAKDIDTDNNWDNCFDNKPKSKEYHDLWLKLSKAEAKNIIEKSGKKSNNYRNSDSDYGSQVPSEKDRYKNAKRKIEKFKELDLGGESFPFLKSEDYSSPDFLTELNGELGKINSLGKDSNLKKFLDANLTGLCTNFENLEEDLNGEDISLDGLQDKLKSDDDIEDSLKKLVNLKKATFKYMFDAAMLDMNSCNNKIELSGGLDEQEYDEDENAPVSNQKYLGFLVSMLLELEKQLENIDINLGGAEQDKEEDNEETSEKQENSSNENAQKKIFYDPYWYISKLSKSEGENKETERNNAKKLKNYYLKRAKLVKLYEYIDNEKNVNPKQIVGLARMSNGPLGKLFDKKRKELEKLHINIKGYDKSLKLAYDLKKFENECILNASKEIYDIKKQMKNAIRKLESEIEERVNQGKKKCEDENYSSENKMLEFLSEGGEFTSDSKEEFKNMSLISDDEYFSATGDSVIKSELLEKFDEEIEIIEKKLSTGESNKYFRFPILNKNIIRNLKNDFDKFFFNKFPDSHNSIDIDIKKYFDTESLKSFMFKEEKVSEDINLGFVNEIEMFDIFGEYAENKKNEQKERERLLEQERLDKKFKSFYENAKLDDRFAGVRLKAVGSLMTPSEQRAEKKKKQEREIIAKAEEERKKQEEEKKKQDKEKKQNEALEKSKREVEARSTPEKFLEYLDKNFGVKKIEELKIMLVDNKKDDKNADKFKKIYEVLKKRYDELVQQVSNKAGEKLKKALEEVEPPKKTIKDFFEPKDSWQIDCLLTMEKRVGYNEYIKITNDDKPNAQRYLKFLCLKNINELDKTCENFKTESNYKDYEEKIKFYKTEYDKVKENNLYL